LASIEIARHLDIQIGIPFREGRPHPAPAIGVTRCKVALMPVVHLLSHDLDADPRDDRALEALLDSSERARAARFAFPHLQRRYRVGRAALRCALGVWTGRPPASLVFETGPQDKPALAGGPAFNVSHSQNQWLLGITPHGRLGIDVELLRRVGDLEAMARHSFAADECAAVLAMPLSERDRAFLEMWTRKEALVKALGGGLSIPLKAFSVALAERPGSLLERLELIGEEAGHWCIRPVSVLPGSPEAVAAIALDAPAVELAWLAPDAVFA
jgi:4'-phosphopantetheinyl transferase